MAINATSDTRASVIVVAHISLRRQDDTSNYSRVNSFPLNKPAKISVCHAGRRWLPSVRELLRPEPQAARQPAVHRAPDAHLARLPDRTNARFRHGAT